MLRALSLPLGLSLAWLATAALAWSQSDPASLSVEDLPLSALRTPLHRSPSAAADDVALWASMDRYKVRFEDGFEIFPALGAAAPRHLPLRWRTASVRVGERELALEAQALPRARGTHALHYERRELCERYDVLVEGVEQSFVFAKPFAVHGDLVIRGAIETPLHAAPRAFAHGAIDFVDEQGRAVLRYGAGFAIDARGCTTEIASRWTGTAIELRVDAAWLASAAFPLVVDPLTSPVTLAGSNGIGGSASSMDVAHHDRPSAEDVLCALTRAWTATDHDVFALRCSSAFAPTQLVYSDVAASFSDTRVSATAVASSSRWIVATQRDGVPATSASRIRLYLHHFDSAVLNSGSSLETATPAAESHVQPQLGGTGSDLGGDEALLVFQSELALGGAATAHSEVRAALIDTGTAQLLDLGVCSATPAGARFDREQPCVSQERGGLADGWVIAWCELDRQSAQDDWDLRGTRTDLQGQRVAEAELVDMLGVADAIQPKIAGRDGSYLVCYARSAVLGGSPNALQARVFEWTSQQSAPVLGSLRSVGSASGPIAAPRCSRVAFDRTTRSHWAIAATRRVLQAGFTWRTVAELYRVGGTAGMVEEVVLFDVPGESSVAPSVCYDAVAGAYRLAWASSSSGAAASAASLLRPAQTGVYIHGTNCGSAWTTQDGVPLAGNRNFGIYVLNANSHAPAVLLLSASLAQVPLDSLGMLGCVLRVDIGPLFLGSFGYVTDAGGSLRVSLPLPDAPAFFGNVYLQWLLPQPGANALGYVLTRGLELKVR